jgi:hypothetical protein
MDTKFVERVLDFEAKNYEFAGEKRSKIVKELGMSVVGYYKNLNEVLDSDYAFQYNSELVLNLRKIRETGNM